MARRSTITRLPKPLLERCNQLIRKGHTIDEILAALNDLGAEVSRSAVGRYVKGARESLERYKQAQAVAKVWVDRLESEPDGDVARLLPEMLRTVAYQTIGQMGEGEDPVKPADVMLMAKALRDLAGTSKTQLEMARQLRDMRAQIKAAARAVEKQARNAGMSKETADQIKQRILGVGDQS